MFINVEGQPVQVVRQSADLELPIVDLRVDTRPISAGRRRGLAADEIYNLSTWSKGRCSARLLRLADDNHIAAADDASYCVRWLDRRVST